MVVGEEETARSEDVSVFMSSTERLMTCDINNNLQRLEARASHRLLNFVNGPFKQHQLLVNCLQKLRLVNNLEETEVRGRILTVGPNATHVGNLVSQLLWVTALGIPFLLIIFGCLFYVQWAVCCYAIFLSVLVSCHSVVVFIIFHNNKIAKRFWFINKVQLDHYCGRENVMMEVTVDDAVTLQFLTGSQKSQVIKHLARSKDKKGVLMMCTKSFWTSRVWDPLLCLLLLIVATLIALIVNVDLLRRHYGFQS